MDNDRKPKFTRREFAGAVAAGLAAPVLLGGVAAQEKKPEATQAPEAAPEEWRERALKALREFPVAEGAEPAFAFRARLR